MNLLPQTWDAFHPLVVHFPIALLLFAPILILLRFLSARWRAGLGAAAMATLLAGTAGAWLAVSTGEAAGEVAERIPRVGLEAAVEAHEEAAEIAAWAFTGLAALYAALLLVEGAFGARLGRGPIAAATAVYLLLYAGGGAALAQAAHQGGLLVHEHGVRARLTGGAGAGGAPGSAGGAGTYLYESEDDED